MADRKILTGISSTAWEHPADRAALQTLRALPGFDEVVRKVAGFFGERGVRQLFLANAVRVGPRQRPKLDAIYTDVLATLDFAEERPELYVSQTPFVNAMAVGFNKPFIVLNSGMISETEEEQQRTVLAHEVGHIMSGHTTYSTIAIILLTIGLRNLPILAGVALLPFQLALLEWYRKAEFSADRAGLLGVQDPEAAMRLFLRMAGGGPKGDEENLEAFLVQAEEYEANTGAMDLVWKVINTAFRDHPFATVRVAELNRWLKSGEYQRIVDGDYPRRGDEKARPLGDDYADAAGYYGGEWRSAVDSVSGMFNRARDAFDSALRGNGGTGGTGGTGT